MVCVVNVISPQTASKRKDHGGAWLTEIIQFTTLDWTPKQTLFESSKCRDSENLNGNLRKPESVRIFELLGPTNLMITWFASNAEWMQNSRRNCPRLTPGSKAEMRQESWQLVPSRFKAEPRVRVWSSGWSSAGNSRRKKLHSISIPNHHLTTLICCRMIFFFCVNRWPSWIWSGCAVKRN